MADAVRTARAAGEWETLTPIVLGGWACLLDGHRELIVSSFRPIPYDVDEIERLDALGLRPFADVDEMPRLTGLDMDLLSLLARGLLRKQIADELFVSTNTIKSQASSLYAKLGASTRDEALAAAEQWGLL